jgi:outer membrane protein assembly factor BamB
MMNKRLGWMALVVVAAVALQLGVSHWAPLSAQPAEAQPAVQQIQIGKQPAINGRVPPMADGNDPRLNDDDDVMDRVNLEKDKNAERKLKEAERLIEAKEWRQAIDLLQSMLDESKDRFMKDEKGRWANVRSEANRLMGGMPIEGIQAYDQYYGAIAKQALQKGLTTSDPQVLADVSMRYKHTEAGGEAAAHLGTYHLDNGRYVVAALCFDRLLEREGQLTKLPDMTLFRAALAFERKGDTAKRQRVWQEFLRRDAGKLPPALRKLSREEQLKLVTAKFEGRYERERFDWPTFGGAQDRSAKGDGGSPFLEKRYEIPLWKDANTKAWLDQAVTRPGQVNRPVISGFHPVAAGNLIIFRSYWGVHAIDVKSGDVEFDAPSLVGLDHIAREITKLDPNGQLRSWQQQYMQRMPQMFFNNTMLGTLTTDNHHAYVIEDLALPPYYPFGGRPIGIRPNMNFGQALAPWFEHNKLVAYNLQTGKVAWEIGTMEPDQPYSDTFFLGAPLLLGDKLYTLGEVNGEIRLLCIDPRKGSLVYHQTLCFLDRKIGDDPVRRTQACHLAYGDGMLICPTNAGVVLGVDLLTRSLVWARPYQSSNESPTTGKGIRQPDLGQGPSWLSSSPVIRDGKVIFTAPDGNWLYCLDTQNGRQLWKLEKNTGDLYMGGVFNDKIIIVGKESIRALHLKDGTTAWSRETGMPSGRGVANQTTYFLPLKAGEVWAIELDNGFVFGKSQSPKGEIPGNLIFHDGEVISQGVFHVTTYPQLQVRENEITKELKERPNDPVALTKRGELRLHRGETLLAVDDLRLALQNNPPPSTLRKTRDKLYEGLSFLLERKFIENEKHLKEFEGLLAVTPLPSETAEQKQKRENEELDRRAKFLQLVARGREAQGRFKEAFQAYVDFARLGYNQLVAIPGEAGTKAPPTVWAQACISNIFRRDLPASVRQELEAAVKSEFEKLEATKDLAGLKSFVALFGPLCQEGGKAQLLLAERLIDAQEFTEAQLKLLALESSTEEIIRARALETLARLRTRNGELRDAAYYYRLLAVRYPRVIVRDGKTGEDLYMELATDKRFFAFLDDARRTWFARQEPRVSQQPGNYPQQQIFWLEPDGEMPPIFQRYRLGVFNNITPMVAKLYDRTTGGELATFSLEGVRPQINMHIQGFRFQPTYRALGNLMVFHWGSMLYAVDPKSGKKVWSHNLLGSNLNININGQTPTGIYIQLVYNQNTGFELYHQDGFRERVNFNTLVTPSIVCFSVKDEGLVAVDPATGNKRWVKMDVPVGAELFGDSQHVFLTSTGKGDAAGVRGLCVRASDGMPVNVNNFGAEFQRKLAIVDRCLLLKDPDAAGPLNGSVFRLYDPLTGKDRWTKKVGGITVTLNSHEPSLFGWIEQGGQVQVVDVATGKEVAVGQVDPTQVAGTPEVHLLADDTFAYIAFNLPNNNNPMQGGRTIQPYGLMMRNINVHGPLLAFNRVTGKEAWKAEVPPQLLILDQFADMPIILCASWQRTFNGANPNQGRFMDVNSVLALDKRNGVKVFAEEVQFRSQFHSLIVDKAAGRVELLSYNYKIVFNLADGATASQPVNPVNPVVGKPPIVKPPVVVKPPIRPVPQPAPIDPDKAQEALKRVIEEIKKDKEGLDREKMEELRRIIEILEKKKQLEKQPAPAKE